MILTGASHPPAQYRMISFNPPVKAGRLCNALSIDVEDYFQVQAFAGQIDRADWDNH